MGFPPFYVREAPLLALDIRRPGGFELLLYVKLHILQVTKPRPERYYQVSEMPGRQHQNENFVNSQLKHHYTNNTSCSTLGHKILVTDMRNYFLVQLLCRIALVGLAVHRDLYESWSKLFPPHYLSKESRESETPKTMHSILHVCMYIFLEGSIAFCSSEVSVITPNDRNQCT